MRAFRRLILVLFALWPCATVFPDGPDHTNHNRFPAHFGDDVESKDADWAVLAHGSAALYNNVWNKGEIKDARQTVFRSRAGSRAGWTWDWPESAGPAIKAYPEIIIGKSPWSEIDTGGKLPRCLSECRLLLDFAYSVEANGSWNESLDFWITSTPEARQKDIVANVTIWLESSNLAPPYQGRHETAKIGGRTYEAILRTRTEDPSQRWNTLCLVNTKRRRDGTLPLKAILDFLVTRRLADSSAWLATTELGSECAYGSGTAIVRTFTLRDE